MAKTVSGEDQGDERKRTTDEVIEISGMASKLGCYRGFQDKSRGNLFTVSHESRRSGIKMA